MSDYNEHVSSCRQEYRLHTKVDSRHEQYTNIQKNEKTINQSVTSRAAQTLE